MPDPAITRQDVINYFRARGLEMPSTSFEALGFLNTELGEVYEVVLASEKWVRNNPGKKRSEFSAQAYAEELGDVIMMAIVAGCIRGVDPIDALLDKMNRKITAVTRGDLPQVA